MDSGNTKSDPVTAAAELEAAASHLEPYIDKLARLSDLMDANNGYMPRPLPQELQIRIDDTYAVHQEAERVFLRYFDLYPNLQDDWISATREQWVMTMTKG